MSEPALHHPALLANTGAVLSSAARDPVPDVAGAEQPPVLVVVIAPVGNDEIGLLTRPTAFAGDWPGMQRVQERQELGDVVAVPAGQRDCERDTGRVDEQVVL